MDELKQAKLQPDSPPDSLSGGFKEAGYTGLKVSAKRITEEANAKFRWPNFISTVDEMLKNPVVYAGIHSYQMIAGRVEYYVEDVPLATNKQKERAKFVNTVLNDMQHSFRDFMQEAFSYVKYGFSVHEIVLKRRTKNNSKYNDGLIGISKLPIRSQATISDWEFSDSGDIIGLWQDSGFIKSDYTTNIKTAQKVYIPISKALLFTADKSKNNPLGESPLKACYMPYKYLVNALDQEAVGMQRDLGGVISVGLPPKYLANNPSAEEKSVREYFENSVRNIQSGSQSGILMPLAYDPDSRQPLFKLDIISSDSAKAYDTDKIIRRYQNDILTALHADILRSGQDGSGSFALADNKSSIFMMAVEHRLKEMLEVVNSKLIPLLFKLNGWDDTEYPQVKYKDIFSISLEEFSKAVQRISSVGAVEQDRSFYNLTREVLGLQAFDKDEPVKEDLIPASTSRSGDGMAVGKTGNGTSNSVSPLDNSAQNLDNKA